MLDAVEMLDNPIVCFLCIQDGARFHFNASELDFAGVDQHLLYSPQTEIVVLFKSQLLLNQDEGASDFECQVASRGKSNTVQEDLGNEKCVRHHHRDLSEESFQVVGQGCATNVEGVQSDE